jgi:hypothetical protein
MEMCEKVWPYSRVCPGVLSGQVISQEFHDILFLLFLIAWSWNKEAPEKKSCMSKVKEQWLYTDYTCPWLLNWWRRPLITMTRSSLTSKPRTWHLRCSLSSLPQAPVISGGTWRAGFCWQEPLEEPCWWQELLRPHPSPVESHILMGLDSAPMIGGMVHFECTRLGAWGVEVTV